MATRGWRTAGNDALSLFVRTGSPTDLRLLAAGALLACWLLTQAAFLPPMWIAVAAMITAFVLGLYARGWRPLLGFAVGFLFFYGYAVTTAELRLASRLPQTQHGLEAVVEGIVIGLPESKQGATGRVQRFLFEPREGPQKRLRISWYRSDTLVKTGQCWRFSLKLRTPRGSQNPGGMDYEGWLFQQGIDANASVQAAEACAAEAHAGVGYLRQRLADNLRSVLAEHPMRPFILGLVLGERSEISTQHWQVLRRAGVSHLLAISGLHIGLIAGFAYFLLSLIWRLGPNLNQYLPAVQAGSLAAALAGLGYAALAGFSLPTIRAVSMLFVAVLAVMLRRRIQSSHLLAVALILVLLLDPFAVTAAGFWLSFGAVAWIFYCLQARLAQAQGWKLWIWLQCVLGLALLPLSLFWFAEGSWLAPVVNLFMIPLFFVLVPVIIGGSLLALTGQAWLGLPLQWAADALQWVWQWLEWLTEWVPVLTVPSTTAAAVMLVALVACLWLFAPRGWPVRPLALLLLLPLFVTQSQQRPALGDLRVTVLDVGQGLSVVLQSRNHVLVYDSGPAWQGGFDAGAMVLVPYLRNQGIHAVDLYMQSHSDLDHRGGGPALQRELLVQDTLGMDAAKPCAQGMQWTWDELHFTVLHPQESAIYGNRKDNNSSCVLRVQVGGKVLLLTGDIERHAELDLLQQQRNQLAADVLLVPHHGSKTSSSIGFLNAVMPELAIVSAGWRNQWDLPAQVVVDRYRARDATVLNTAESGAISFVLGAEQGVRELRQYRRYARKFWHAD
ncbi:MAG: DNA internalization-related competence protein ComEC/Rec2 [Nevskiales bacterium]